MKISIGKIDRFIWALVVIMLIVLCIANEISIIKAVIGIAISILFILTSFASVCKISIPFMAGASKKKKTRGTLA
jgi:hypothetical protein